MIRKLRRLAELPLPELAVLLQLVACALALDIALRLFSLPRLIHVLNETSHWAPLRSWPIFKRECAEVRVPALVDIVTAATHGRTRCLIRSLILYWLTQAEQKKVNLLLGVQKIAGTLEGHAWIETQGRVIQDTPDIICRFTPVLKFEAR